MTEMLEGGCQCGAIRYRLSGEPVYTALCHCSDCRKSAGAPIVHWAAFAESQVELLAGRPQDYQSSPNATRSFCPTCGTGLFFRNGETLPGLVDVQAATLDDPAALPPRIHVQTAERLDWLSRIEDLPAFERYPQA